MKNFILNSMKKPGFFAIKIVGKDKKNKYALIQIPTDFSRFYRLDADDKEYFILLDDIIRFYLKNIFKIFEFEEISAYTFKFSRDAELNLDDDYSETLIEKINKIAKKIYRASEVTMDDKVKAQIENLQKNGYGHFPICVAKTQSSFSIDPKLRGAPSNHSIVIREIRLSAGAEFVVIICGSIMTMPGLPKVPSAEKINYVNGKIIGLS